MEISKVFDIKRYFGYKDYDVISFNVVYRSVERDKLLLDDKNLFDRFRSWLTDLISKPMFLSVLVYVSVISLGLLFMMLILSVVLELSYIVALPIVGALIIVCYVPIQLFMKEIKRYSIFNVCFSMIDIETKAFEHGEVVHVEQLFPAKGMFVDKIDILLSSLERIGNINPEDLMKLINKLEFCPICKKLFFQMASLFLLMQYVTKRVQLIEVISKNAYLSEAINSIQVDSSVRVGVFLVKSNV